MPVYTYKVKNSEGEIFSGETKVNSKEVLLDLFNKHGYKPVEIIEKTFVTDVSQIGIFRKKVKTADLAQFCRQFSIMLEAGISIAAALDVLKAQTVNPTLKECLNDIYNNIQKGISLSSVMRSFPDIFPPILISMVEAGEVSGQLDKVFIRMADHFEKEYKQKQKLKAAMTYPVIVFVIAVLVVVIIVVKVIPTFGEALAGMNVELPKLTQIMLNVSNFFTRYWYLVLFGLVVLIFGIKMMSKTNRGKKVLDNAILKIPIAADVIKTMLTARLSRALATLLSSGVLMLESLEITRRVLNNSILDEKMEKAIESVKQGRSLTQSITEMQYFPPLVLSMLKTGEEAGNLDETLEKAADFYEDQTGDKLQKLMTFIEPMIMIGLGGVVAFIIFSVLYPMLSVYQNIGNY
ncbi:MAG: type II secretion system F family protein [Clostridiaceae bacterium]|jgi:type IV pilus assembly protein PilC|nr:type II secretion system F family protein [Clostridiaceae bacterium]